MKHQLRVLTNSQMRMLRRCAKEYFFYYVLLLRAVTQHEALRFGALIHLGLEAWWKTKQAGRPFAAVAALEAMRPHAANDFELVMVSALIGGYDARWGDEEFEVIAVEGQTTAPLVNPTTGEVNSEFQLGMKLDVLVRQHGRYKIIEHKTSSRDISPGSDYWKALPLDSQLSTYIAGARAAGYEIEECLYDVIGKPQLRGGEVPLTDEHGAKIVLDAEGRRVRTARGKWRETADASQGYVLQKRAEEPREFYQRLVEHIAENPDRYYQRGTVVRLEREEDEAAQDAWHSAEIILENERNDRWLRNPDACLNNRRCDYFDVCTGTASIDDVARFRKATAEHEELQLDVAAE